MWGKELMVVFSKQLFRFLNAVIATFKHSSEICIEDVGAPEGISSPCWYPLQTQEAREWEGEGKEGSLGRNYLNGGQFLRHPLSAPLTSVPWVRVARKEYRKSMCSVGDNTHPVDPNFTSSTRRHCRFPTALKSKCPFLWQVNHIREQGPQNQRIFCLLGTSAHSKSQGMDEGPGELHEFPHLQSYLW